MAPGVHMRRFAALPSASKRPDKMMAGAAGPSAAARWARSALSAPQQAGRVPVDARGVGSKHGDDREKPRPREMPVVGRAGLRLPAAKTRRSLSHRASSSDELGSGGGRKQKAEKQPIRQIWRCVSGSPAQNRDDLGGASATPCKGSGMAPPPHRLSRRACASPYGLKRAAGLN